MVSITLKDIPPTVHRALKARAKQHGRSLNREALACLENAVAPSKVDVPAMLANIRRHRESLPGRLTDRLILEAKSDGRP